MTFDFRLALEIGAADRIIAHLTAGILAGIRDAQARMRLLVSSIDPKTSRDFLRLDAEFHDRIIAAAGNEVLLEHYRQVNTLSAVVRARGRNAAAVNPEEAMAAALLSCHMMTFLALCNKARWRLSGYRDHAVATLGRMENGRTRIAGRGARRLSPRALNRS